MSKNFISKNLCLTTTITTVLATLAFAAVAYMRAQSFELMDAVVFAAVFGVFFFFGQECFSKSVKKRK